MAAKEQHPQEKGIVTFSCFDFSSRHAEAELWVAVTFICTDVFFQMLQAALLSVVSCVLMAWHEDLVFLGLSKEL